MRVAILGNCVAQRFQRMLPRWPGFGSCYEILSLPMIHHLARPEERQAVAGLALACDVLLTQPLFRFGPCNTDTLRVSLRSGQRLAVFASPNFEAYFPDIFSLLGKRDLRFEPPLEWDSLIIFSCYLRQVPILEVQDLYLNHALFSRAAAQVDLSASLEHYAERERNLDIGTFSHAFKRYGREKLFHTPRHPTDDLLCFMLKGAAEWLGLATAVPECAVEGFSFNQWPIITRHHDFFRFPEQDYFMIAGRRFSLEDVAMAYYNFYDFHPHIVEANRHRAIEV